MNLYITFYSLISKNYQIINKSLMMSIYHKTCLLEIFYFDTNINYPFWLFFLQVFQPCFAFSFYRFVGLDRLQWLKLDGNSLSTLQPQVVMPLRTLHGVALHGNPWVCTCDLMPFRQWMLSRNMPLSVPPGKVFVKYF